MKPASVNAPQRHRAALRRKVDGLRSELIAGPGGGGPPAWSPDRVFVLSLARRPDRLRRFREGLTSAGWPFGPVELFSAVDGAGAAPAAWRRSGLTAGAWGCLHSHAAALEVAFRSGDRSALVLEDDALFPAGFPARVRQFLEAAPGDWDGLMLGGEHTQPPCPSRCWHIVLAGTTPTACWPDR